MTNRKLSERLSKALAPLAKGETVDGKPLDLAKIAAETHARARDFARKIASGQARTAYTLRGLRFVG